MTKCVKPILIIGILLAMLLPLALGVNGQSASPITLDERYEAMPFGPGAVVIPMDEKQNDTILSFGLVHALLRNETVCYRLIGPPDSFIKTDAFPDGANYSGGPILLSGFNEVISESILRSWVTVSQIFAGPLQ